MRSEIVFRSQERVANRYKLCQVAAKVTRCLHFASANTQDAISDAFVRIADEPDLVMQPAAVATPRVAPEVFPAIQVKEFPAEVLRVPLSFHLEPMHQGVGLYQ